MKSHKIVFTSDVHGNNMQIRKLIEYSISKKADTIVIGGDIAPKNLHANYIQEQRRYLQQELPRLLTPLKENLPDSKLFLMMGNDDCAINMDVLEKEEQNGLFTIINGKRVKLTSEFDITGYSYVPITPFGIKDWEKFDFSHVPRRLEKEYEFRKKTNYRLQGFKSRKKGRENFVFTNHMEKNDSIQKDLEKELFKRDAKKTIYVFHAPPNNTALDLIMQGMYKYHVGSFAVREFIEKNQPYLTLHGHIHETVDISGRFQEQINSTICIAAGNHNEFSSIAILNLDLYNPKDVQRISL